MKEKKKSAVSWILTWAGQKRIAYVWSVLLAIGNVIFKILPYFIIADVVKLFLNGEKEFEIYLAKAVLIALSFIIAELLHSLSTALSHKATFAVLANIRKSCCDKLARVPLGYVKDTPSGTFKNIMVERIDSIETTLAHIVPEFTSNLLAPIVILIYFFLTDWRLALWSLVPVIVGFLSYFGMMLDYKPSSVSHTTFCSESFLPAFCITELTPKKISTPAAAISPILQSKINSIRMIIDVSRIPCMVSITTLAATSPSISIVLVVMEEISPILLELKYPIGR